MEVTFEYIWGKMWVGPVNESISNCKPWKFGNNSSYINVNIPRCPLAAAWNSRHCDLSIVVAFWHNELWWPPAANSLSVTSQVLWPLATTNCGSWRPQMVALHCGINLATKWPIWQTLVARHTCVITMADCDGKTRSPPQ